MALLNSQSAEPVENGQIIANEMLRSPARANLVSSSSGAFLDQSAKVIGKLKFESPARIEGQIEGEIEAHDSVTIGANAVVSAKISAVAIVVAGTVTGEIEASQRIELQPSAIVSGTVTTPKLIVHEGAVFDGNCSMQRKAAGDDRAATTSRNGNGAQLDS